MFLRAASAAEQALDGGVVQGGPRGRRESVSLAFVTALQLLPASQRAVLILREVLGFPAADVADQLDMSVAAVNSALQRARATLAAGVRGPSRSRQLTDTDRVVLGRFVDAWHRRAIDELVALLHEDAVLRMPPQPLELRGWDAVAGFFATVPAGGRLDLFRLTPTRANGHPAIPLTYPTRQVTTLPTASWS